MSTREKVKFGMAIPQIFQDGHVDMALVRESVQKAEALGYHSLWVQEGIVGDVPILEAVSLLCYAAAISTDLRLGVSVLVTPLHHPVHLAKTLSTLDQMSGGRLVVGIGVGPDARFSHPFGIPLEGRVRRFVEGLDVMKALWTKPSAHIKGKFWQLEGAGMEPKPVQKPHPPVWFGGHHPNALRRAVRHGDGWMGAGASSTAQFKESVAVLRRCLESEGRDPATFPISKRVYMAVDDDEGRAEKRLREWFGRSAYKNADLAAEVCVWGSAAICIEQLAEITTAGAQLLLLNPVFDVMEHVDRLAEGVMPHL